MPVVQVTAESRHLGGAANVVHNLRALGGRSPRAASSAPTPPAAICSTSSAGSASNAEGVVRAAPPSRRARRASSPTSSRWCASTARTTARRDSSAAARARGFLLAHLGSADVVVISDYGKGLVTPELLAALAALRARSGRSRCSSIRRRRTSPTTAAPAW